MRATILRKGNCLQLPAAAICVLLAVASPRLKAEDYYVSPGGDDGGPGTLAHPFATLNRARLAVRQQLSTTLQEDIQVIIRDGIYRIESPIEFDINDSPHDSRMVRYMAYPGEHPVISGGRQLVDWEENPDGAWTTTIDEVRNGNWTFRELFVNGRRRQRARHPNSGFLRAAGPSPSITASPRLDFRFYPGDLPATTDLANAEINMLHEWTVSRVRIARVNHGARVLSTAEPLGATGLIDSIFQTEVHPRYAVENDPALLDAPGEWYLDTATGVLTYLPLPGEFIESAEIVAPVATALLIVRGDFGSETPVRNLVFDGLTFEHCAWALPIGGYSTYQSGYYEQRGNPHYDLPAAITLELADHCKVIRCRVAHCGGWGVLIGAWCTACELTGSVVTDIAGNGVLVGEDRFRNAGGNFWYLGRPDQAAFDNRVTSNLIQDCGVELQDCAGLWNGLTVRSSLTSNVVRRLPHIAVSVGALWNADPSSPSSENTIADNRISDVVQLLSDGGGIYTVGAQPGSVIRNNLISGIPPKPGLSQNNGIYLDQGSTGFEVVDNGIYDVAAAPFKFHIAGVNQLRSNTMRLNSNYPIPYFLVSTPVSNIVISDDVVINSESPPMGCEAPVCGEAATAGLMAEFQPLIFADSDGDGIADVDDACPRRKPGDINGDGRIDGLDVQSWIDVARSVLRDSDGYCAADLNGDGIVNRRDAAQMMVELLR